MNDTTIRFYLFYGNDDYGMEQAVRSLISKMGDPATASMNISEFEAGVVDLPALREACFSMPFLTDRRLVILHHVEHLSKSKETIAAYLEILENLPPTTALVFTEMFVKVKSKEIEHYRQKSAWVQWIDAHKQAGYGRLFLRPEGAQFVSWVRSYCREAEAEIDPKAAQLLASLVADDAQLASLEIDKLIAFTNGERAIRVADVEQLTPYHGQSDVFAMVDAIGNRQGREASRHLHRLLEDKDEMFAFHMIVRQFRFILQAQEAANTGQKAAQAVKQPHFVVRKIVQQARHFSIEDTERILHHLLDIDVSCKSGKADLATSLYALTATLTS